MSEYQYYEFQTADRHLSDSQMRELRGLSTRAEITRTSFTNEYHWSDFKGEPLEMMEKCFDFFYYFANWGTHEFMIRVPKRLLNPKTVAPYAAADDRHGCFSHWAGQDNLILRFHAEDEESTWDENEPGLSDLIPIRADLLAGDLRLLYLGWLLLVQSGDVKSSAKEPPVPAGLANLTPSLERLARFMRLDPFLIEAAAKNSPSIISESRPAMSEELEKWINSQPEEQRTSWLLNLIRNDDPYLRQEILREFWQVNRSPEKNAPPQESRTAGELLELSQFLSEEAKKREAKRRAEAKAAHLESLALREGAVWLQIDELFATSRARDHDQAMQLLKELHELSLHKQTESAFLSRIQAIRKRHAKRQGIVRRLNEIDVTKTP